MGVVGGAGGVTIAARQHHIQHVPAIDLVVVIRRDAVDYLDGVRALQRHHVLFSEVVPGRVSDRHERPGVQRPLRDLWAGFARQIGRKIQRQTDRQNVPQFAGERLPGVQFRAEQRGEFRRAKRAGVADRIFKLLHEMIGNRQKVVAHLAVEAADQFRRQPSVRVGRMGVQIAAIKATRLIERCRSHPLNAVPTTAA